MRCVHDKRREECAECAKPPADSKPREWWIGWPDAESGEMIFDVDPNDPRGAVHVIEHSAYTQLEREHDRYRGQSETYALELVDMTRERDKYKAALERIANPLPFNAGDKIACLLSIEGFTKIAREALEDNGNNKL